MSKSKKAQNLTKEDILQAYEDMLLLRRFEERVGQLYGTGVIGGFCHLYIGQEAVAVGMKKALHKDDAIITSYRDHGFMLIANQNDKQKNINSTMAELLGKDTGCSKGKGGSMHIFDTQNGFYGGHGIVGAQVPLGTGIAFAYKYKNQNNISVTIFGDGAANQGQVYESFNMAKLWNLPVLYIIENNEYAMGTSIGRACATTDFHNRGASFNIPGKLVDGMSFIAVHDAMVEAVEYVRNGNGPFILEMKTYRYRGHSMSDPAKYRTKEEVDEHKTHDPLDIMKKYILDEKLAKEELFDELEKKINISVKQSVDFAQNSKEPDEKELYTDVY